jgi:acyl carrier protein
MSTKTREEITIEVIGLIERELGVSGIEESHNIGDLSKDSIQLFELLLALQAFYEVEVLYEDIVNLNTVEDIIQYVSRVKYQ